MLELVSGCCRGSTPAGGCLPGTVLELFSGCCRGGTLAGGCLPKNVARNFWMFTFSLARTAWDIRAGGVGSDFVSVEVKDGILG